MVVAQCPGATLLTVRQPVRQGKPRQCNGEWEGGGGGEVPLGENRLPGSGKLRYCTHSRCIPRTNSTTLQMIVLKVGGPRAPGNRAPWHSSPSWFQSQVPCPHEARTEARLNRPPRHFASAGSYPRTSFILASAAPPHRASPHLAPPRRAPCRQSFLSAPPRPPPRPFPRRRLVPVPLPS